MDLGAIVAVALFTALLLGLPLMMGWLENRRSRQEKIPLPPPDDAPTGYWKLGTIAGVSILVRASILVTALVIALGCSFFSTILSVDYTLNPLDLLYFAIGYIALIGLHEWGHVAAARYLRLKVWAVELSDLGGLVRCEAPRDAISGLVLYSGGLAAQLVLLILTLAGVAWFGRPSSGPALCLLLSFTFVNVILAIINLMPRTTVYGVPTDGYMLRGLVLHLWKGAPNPMHGVIFQPDTRLQAMKEFLPENLVAGVEILNDATTPTDFVVETLGKHLRVDRKNAIELMMRIHRKGGVIVPLASAEEAELVVSGISIDNENSGNKLLCRAVDVAKRA